MFEIASEWKLIVNESRKATLDKNGEISNPILAIEPNINFTFNTIGIYVTSLSAPPHWYAAGEVFQIFKTGFGTAGYAQGESVKIVLNRYHVYKFTIFPFIPNISKYLLSFVPRYYLKDVNIKVWEYVGANQGVTLESLNNTVKTTQQQVLVGTATIKALLNKTDR